MKVEEMEEDLIKQALWFKSGYTQGFAMAFIQAELEASSIAKDQMGDISHGAELAKQAIQKRANRSSNAACHAIDWYGTIVNCQRNVEIHLLKYIDDPLRNATKKNNFIIQEET